MKSATYIKAHFIATCERLLRDVYPAIAIGCALCLFLPQLSAAQQTSAAPKPAQLARAKTVFISNASEANGGESDKNYDRFYAAVQSLKRFTIVLTPGEADLVLEFSYLDGKYTKSTGGSPEESRQKLRILDPKSNALLWSVTEPATGRFVGHDQNNQDALNRLAEYLKQLATSTTPTE